MLSSDPTSCLAQALFRRRVILRQCVALAGVLVGFAAWRLSPLGEPEPYTGFVLVIGSAALIVDLAMERFERARATAYADELILSGFTFQSARTPIEQAVSHRLDWVVKPGARHRLSRELRWRLRLADGSLAGSPGYLRASVLPPLVAYERQALLAEYGRVREMADRIDRAPADPRALVLLWSVVSAPPSLDTPVGREAGEELGGGFDRRRRYSSFPRTLRRTPVSSQLATTACAVVIAVHRSIMRIPGDRLRADTQPSSV